MIHILMDDVMLKFVPTIFLVQQLQEKEIESSIFEIVIDVFYLLIFNNMSLFTKLGSN